MGKTVSGVVGVRLSPTHVLRDSHVLIELVALPQPRSILDRGAEVVILQPCEPEHVLQGIDLVVGPCGEDTVDVVDDQREIGAAIHRHALLDGVEVGPVV